MIRKVIGGGDFSSGTNIFPLTFPLQEYFFRMQELSIGLLAVHEPFFTQFSLARFFFFFALRPPPLPPDSFSNGP